MNLRERTAIDRPAALVWHYIVTPELFQQWNDKIVAIEARGAFQLGQRFSTQYEMSRKPLQCWSQVTRLEEGHLLELRHGNCSGQGIRRDIEVVERVTLEEKDGHTIVTKDVTIRNSGVIWFVVPLIWFINRFGKPVGKDRLRELCEGKAEAIEGT
jgi:uncharacterized protein YndB with AHSA1/START domain